MSEQRRRLGDVCVLAVPAEYAGASSGSGDCPQQYYLHRPNLPTLEEKDFFPIFFYKKYFYPDPFILVNLTRLTPLGTHLNPPPRGGSCVSA